MINKRTRAQILQLVNEEGIPIRHVARMLGISRNTVKKYLRFGTDSVDQASRLSDDGAFLASHKEAVAKLYTRCELRCPPLQRLIEKELNRTIPLRMLQRFCHTLRQERNLQMLQKNVPQRFESAPGKQMQIDFGEKDVLVGGVLQRLHFFVCKLGYSRRIFAKAYFSETQDAWLDGMESAFRYFGGKPLEIVCDNASSLVRDHYAREEERRFTERFYQFALYYGITPIATAVRKPRSKGKVEAGVKYLKMNLPGEDQPDLRAWNIWLEGWCRKSDSRKLTTVFDGARTPAERWQLEEPRMRRNDKPPMVRMFLEIRKVSRDGLIRVENKSYRVADSLIGREVQIQIDESTISVLHGAKVVAVLDKTAHVFNPEPQGESSGKSSQRAVEKKLRELEHDEQWKAYKACGDELSADSRLYDDAIGWTGWGSAS